LPSAGELQFLEELKRRPPFLTHDQSPVSNDPGTRLFPGYEMLGELGRGSIGIVYRARQTRLDRLVALKMLLAGSHAGEDALRRFRTEAEAAARLHHPSIVQIHGIGDQDGRPYLVLELVEGGSLADYLAGTPQPLLLAAQLVETLARTLQYAHGQGIVHRDMKPANVLLAPNRERFAAGNSPIPDPRTPRRPSLDAFLPKISDFGLAKRLGGEANQTLDGSVLGTPSYMAPEQAVGRGKEIGPAADVYALGAILYELLTGRPPFKAETPLDTVLQVIHQVPVSPRQLRPRLPRDLETVCLKCLEKAPARRYPSALALADDLRRYLDQKPIHARPVPAWERAWRWSRRNPALASLGMLTLLLLLAGTGVSTFFAYRAEQRASEAIHERERARQAMQEAEYRSYVSDLRLASVRWDAGQIDLLLQLLDAHRPKRTEDPDWRDFEWHYWHNLCQSELQVFRGHTASVDCVAFSPDGRRLASAGADGSVRVWDASGAGQSLLLRGHTDPVTSIAFSPDGTLLASVGADQSLRLWDLGHGRLSHVHRCQGNGGRVAFAPDGLRLATASWPEGTVTIQDVPSGREILTMQGHSREVAGLAFSPEGRLLATGGGDGTVQLWDASSGQQILVMQGHTMRVTGVVFSPDGTRLASVSHDGTLRVWDAVNGRALLTFRCSASPALSVAFSPDGRRLASSGDWNVRVWDAADGRELRAFKGHTANVQSVAFSPDGHRLASAGGKDLTVKVWDAEQDQGRVRRQDHRFAVNRVAFRPDGQRMATAAGFLKVPDGEVRIWDTHTGQQVLALSGQSAAVYSVAYSPDGRLLASAGEDRLVRIWEADSGRPLLTFSGHSEKVWHAVFSPDGKRVASVSEDQTVRVWDARTGQEVAPPRLHPGKLSDVAFSPDGRRLASAGWDGTVRVWESATDRDTLTLRGHTEAVWCVAFSPDGQRLASAGNDGTVRLWDATSGQELYTLRGHSKQVSGLAFKPDGRRLASAGWDGTVRLWDCSTGQETLTLNGQTPRVFAVAFSPDGHQLVAGSREGVVCVWDATTRIP
jgi:WD40 repeat protein/serine/threonine protein kinase